VVYTRSRPRDGMVTGVGSSSSRGQVCLVLQMGGEVTEVGDGLVTVNMMELGNFRRSLD